MNYVYMYNCFADYEQALMEADHRALFHRPYTTSLVITDEDVPFHRSCFIKWRLEVLHEAGGFSALLEDVKNAGYDWDGFKVTYLKNKVTHHDYNLSLSETRQLADAIDGDPDMKHPQITLGLTYTKGTYYFGIVEDNKDWNAREYKPQSYSHSLPVRIARTALVMAAGTASPEVIDPCCGVGTVVLEGLSMGLDIRGSDINRFVAYKARQNMIYYNEDPMLIERKDIHDITEHYDAAVIDVPYGVYAYVSTDEQLALIQAALAIADRVVAVTHLDLKDDYLECGWHVLDGASCRRGGFYRYLYVLEETHETRTDCERQ